MDGWCVCVCVCVRVHVRVHVHVRVCVCKIICINMLCSSLGCEETAHTGV